MRLWYDMSSEGYNMRYFGNKKLIMCYFLYLKYFNFNVLMCVVGDKDWLRFVGLDVFKLFVNCIIINYCYGYMVFRLGVFIFL